MKKIFLGVAIVFGLTANSQEIDKQVDDNRTVFNGIRSFGGFMGVSSKVGDVNGQSALLAGVEFAAVLSSQINIGFVGYGLTTHVESDASDSYDNPYDIHMGYGGLLIEPVIASKRMVHLSFPIILGVGGAGTHKSMKTINQIRKANNDLTDRDNVEFYRHETDVILVGEPGINLEINLLKNMRLNLGGSYRYVYDSQIEDVSDEELSGPMVSAGLRFGWF